MLLRGVFVPHGRHEVALRYRPRSLTAGLIAVALACAILLVGAFLIRT
jgi:hypothetical protein